MKKPCRFCCRLACVPFLFSAAASCVEDRRGLFGKALKIRGAHVYYRQETGIMKDLTGYVYDFEELIRGDFLYVDKTEYIRQPVRNAKGMYSPSGRSSSSA